MKSWLLVPFGLLAVSVQPALADAKDDLAENRIEIARVGECIVAKHHVDASRAIRENMTYDEIARAYPSVIDAQCLSLWNSNRSLDKRVHLIQYALADALFRADLATAATFDVKGAPRLNHRIFAYRAQIDTFLATLPDPERRRKVEEAAALMWRVGECLVRDNVSGARAVLKTEVASAEEQIALNRLRHSYDNCGRKLLLPAGFLGSRGYADFTAMQIRGSIALSYYRMAAASSIVPGNAR